MFERTTPWLGTPTGRGPRFCRRLLRGGVVLAFIIVPVLQAWATSYAYGSRGQCVEDVLRDFTSAREDNNGDRSDQDIQRLLEDRRHFRLLDSDVRDLRGDPQIGDIYASTERGRGYFIIEDRDGSDRITLSSLNTNFRLTLSRREFQQWQESFTLYGSRAQRRAQELEARISMEYNEARIFLNAFPRNPFSHRRLARATVELLNRTGLPATFSCLRVSHCLITLSSVPTTSGNRGWQGQPRLLQTAMRLAKTGRKIQFDTALARAESGTAGYSTLEGSQVVLNWDDLRSDGPTETTIHELHHSSRTHLARAGRGVGGPGQQRQREVDSLYILDTVGPHNPSRMNHAYHTFRAGDEVSARYHEIQAGLGRLERAVTMTSVDRPRVRREAYSILKTLSEMNAHMEADLSIYREALEIVRNERKSGFFRFMRGSVILRISPARIIVIDSSSFEPGAWRASQQTLVGILERTIAENQRIRQEIPELESRARRFSNQFGYEGLAARLPERMRNSVPSGAPSSITFIYQDFRGVTHVQNEVDLLHTEAQVHRELRYRPASGVNLNRASEFLASLNRTIGRLDQAISELSSGDSTIAVDPHYPQQRRLVLRDRTIVAIPSEPINRNRPPQETGDWSIVPQHVIAYLQLLRQREMRFRELLEERMEAGRHGGAFAPFEPVDFPSD